MGIRGLITNSDIIDPIVNIYNSGPKIYSIADNGYFIYDIVSQINTQTSLITVYAKTGKTLNYNNTDLFIYSNGWQSTRSGYIYYNYYYKTDFDINIISAWVPTFNNNNTQFANPNIVNNNTFNILNDMIIVGGEYTKVNNKNISYFSEIDSISGLSTYNLKTMTKPFFIVNSQNDYITGYDSDYIYIMKYYDTPFVSLSGNNLYIDENLNISDPVITNVIHIDANNILFSEPYLTYFSKNNGALLHYNLNSDNELVKTQTLLPANTQQNLMYGNSMSYTSLSRKLAVGAPGYDNYKGKVFVYDYNTSKIFDTETSITPTLTSQELFGYSTAIYDNKLIVGAPNALSGTGCVYFYQNTGNSWELKQILSAPSNTGMYGVSLDLYDETLAIACPTSNEHGSNNGAIYVYSYSDITSTFNYNTSLGPQFLNGFNTTDYYLGGGITYSGNVSADLINYNYLHNIGYKIKLLNNENIFASALRASLGFDIIGQAYHYQYTNSQWTTAQVLSSINTTSSFKKFGSDISLYRNNVLITSYLDNDNGGSSIYYYINDGLNNMSLDRIYTNDNSTRIASMSDNIFVYNDSPSNMYYYLLPQEITLYDDNDSVGPIYNNYEFVERIKGVNRIGMDKLHKSNIFSIEINNSKLNENITDANLRQKVQKSVVNVIKEVIKKIIPAHTKLWKIDWTGE